MDPVARFYDDLTDHYHLMLADWKASVRHQGALLDRLITERLGPGPRPILDATCGIGTQAIGLALQGHKVTGTDIGPAAIARARNEAKRFGVALALSVADLRSLSSVIEGPFPVVLAFDNALPHLLSDEELAAALGQVAAVLESGGLFLASIRDYDKLAVERPRATAPRVVDDAEGRRVVFQVWDWDRQGAFYDLTIYILRHGEAGVDCLSFASRYRALRRRDLERTLSDAGFERLQWIEPSEDGFYQPVIAAWRR